MSAEELEAPKTTSETDYTQGFRAFADMQSSLGRMGVGLVRAWSETTTGMWNDGIEAGQRQLTAVNKFWESQRAEAEIGMTPKEAIWGNGPSTLYRYERPAGVEAAPKARPLLLSWALMNSPEVFDFRPGRSFVEFMLGQGYDVYLFDPGSPGYKHKDLGFEDYAESLGQAAEKVREVSGSDEWSLLGWCQGALISSMLAATKPEGLNNLILLTAPLDFSDPNCGGFATMANDQSFNPERIVALNGGLMPGELIDYAAKMLKPYDNLVGAHVNLWESVRDGNEARIGSWEAMQTWMRKLRPMAGRAYVQLINDFYRGNKLIKGEVELNGQHIDLGNIEADVLCVVADQDHITPPALTLGAVPFIGNPLRREAGVQNVSTINLPGGHIGSMLSPKAWRQIDDWLAPRSGDDRLAA